MAERFQIASPTANKYIKMSTSDINAMCSPKKYKERDTPMNKWRNIIFKMMVDGHKSETIFFYIRSQSNFKENVQTLAYYIRIIGENNFSDRPCFFLRHVMDLFLPEGIIRIKRSEILKYLLTVNPKTKKDETVGMYIDVIKEQYPIARKVESIFKEFHSVIMGNQTEALDDFLHKYEASEIRSFCNGVNKDIISVKNAIIFPISSGFVEGNNNKFKLIKRIVYGRSKLENLTKKCKLAFLPKSHNFELSSLI